MLQGHRRATRLVFALCLFLSGTLLNDAQSGGTFQLEQTVVAPGSAAGGGTFSSQFVIGEPAVGKGIAGGRFSLSSGFWQFPQLAPTAAGVTVGGRVLTADGQPIRGVRLSLLNSAGVAKTALTNPFGYFRFDDVTAGQTYILAAVGKDHEFAPQVVSVETDIADISLISLN